MVFEFDPVNSAKNLSKHGIDFIAAQGLWEDPEHVETNAMSSTEPRFQVLGIIGEGLWSAIVTYRRENIRIISVRRAREEETKLYHGKR
jgi:uncharacterized protein